MEAKQIIKTQIDTHLFAKQVPCIKVIVPNNHINVFQKQFGKLLLTAPKFKPCQLIEGDEARKMLVLRSLEAEDCSKVKEHVEKFNSSQADQPKIEIN